MVAVAHRVAVADADDGDRRQHGPALLGKPHPLPADTGLARRAERAVEHRCLARLERPVDLVERDLADAVHRPGRAAAQDALVVDLEATAFGGLAAQPAGDRGAAAPARDAGEGLLRVDMSRARHQHVPIVGYDGRAYIGHLEPTSRRTPYAPTEDSLRCSYSRSKRLSA